MNPDEMREKADAIKAKAYKTPPFFIAEDSIVHVELTRVLVGILQVKMTGFKESWEGLVTDECLRGMLYTKGKTPVVWVPEGFDIEKAKITEMLG